MSIIVRKADGTEESFDESKLRQSLKRSGASTEACEQIISEIKRVFAGKKTSTSQIYKRSFKLLREIEKPQVAARYSLKRALLGLGPSGFPFEYFIAEIYQAKGYKTETGVIMKGGCAVHEVDVVARNEEEVRAIEAKFHNSLGFKTDLKVLLYIAARMEDLSKSRYDKRQKDGQKGYGMIVTNTEFTKNALEYAECIGVEAISWGYPRKGNLHDMIEEAGLHPLTCLTTLSAPHKKTLLDRGVVLCKTVIENKESLRRLGMSDKKIAEVVDESEKLCVPGAAF